MQLYFLADLIPIPGADQALRGAEASGWTAVLMCGTFLLSLASLIWLIKKMFADKDDLANRLSSVEDFQKTKMVEMHVTTATACNRAAEACEINSRAVDKLTEALIARPCLLPRRPESGG